MAKKPKQRMRARVWVPIVVIWTVTALVVIILMNLTRPGPIRAEVLTSELAFKSASEKLFTASNYEDVLVSGIVAMSIARSAADAPSNSSTRADYSGSVLSRCVFTHVRSEPIELQRDADVRMIYTASDGNPSLALSSTGRLRMSMTSQPADSGAADVTCSKVSRSADNRSDDLSYALSKQGGDSISIVTTEGARLDMRMPSAERLQDTQISLVNRVRFSTIDVVTGDEKTTLLADPSHRANNITFEAVERTKAIDPADILQIDPGSDFWITRLSVDGGLRLNLHGTATNVYAGGGPGAMSQLLPTALDSWLTFKGALALIPAVAGAIVAFLEKLGALS
jgi:hypothetical protein